MDEVSFWTYDTRHTACAYRRAVDVWDWYPRDRATYKRTLARGEVSWTFFLLAPRKTRSFTVHGNCFKLSRILNTNVTLMHREALSSSESHSFASNRNKNFLCFKIATNEKACWIAHRMRVLARCRRLGLAPARQNNLQTHAGERWSFVDFLYTCTKENQVFHCTWELF